MAKSTRVYVKVTELRIGQRYRMVHPAGRSTTVIYRGKKNGYYNFDTLATKRNGISYGLNTTDAEHSVYY